MAAFVASALKALQALPPFSTPVNFPVNFCGTLEEVEFFNKPSQDLYSQIHRNGKQHLS